MSKNIVLLSDGTGNSSAKIFKTNVWRLFQALDLTDPGKQVAYYDNGVGTSSFKLFAALGGIFGFGLKRNIIDIYSFCCRNYSEGDNIYGFGFSRGAFTIRVVASFISTMGLVPYDGSEANLARDARTAYRRFLSERKFHSGILVTPLRKLRDFFRHTILRKPTVEKIGLIPVKKFHFLGVWDTVDAYGGPIEEITRAIDYYYWPLSMPDQFMNQKITRACHALAIEEERDAFKPVLWDERYVRGDGKLRPIDQDWTPPPSEPDKPLAAIDKERISQVWFVGVHSDIGGGYPQDGLSYFSLKWMMKRAEVYGLTFLVPVQDAWMKSLVGPYDKLNDSRHGFGGYYRYRPRNLRDLYRLPPYKLSIKQDVRRVLRMLVNKDDPEDELREEWGGEPALRPVPKIHQAVLDRIAKGNDGYAPIVLPQAYNVVTHAGELVANTSLPIDAHAATRARRQGTVWDLVWGRRIVYFLTVFAALYLAALPLIEKWRPGRGAASPFEIVTPLIDLAGAFLPSFVKPWLDAFRNSPGRFVAGLLAMLLLMWIGGWMQTRIRDLMRVIWNKPADKAERDDSWIHRLRSAGPYKAFFYVLKQWILPTIFAAIIFAILLYVGFCLVSRVSFMVFDATGHVCTSAASAVPVTKTISEEKSFETKALCAPTGLQVKKGANYEVVLTITDPWEDGYKFKFAKTDPRKAKGIETGPEGFGYDKTTLKMYSGLPLRRQIASNWFATILRVGNTGFGEVTPVFTHDEAPNCPCSARYTAKFKAPKDGEVFVYVNDSVIGFPGYFDMFYREDAWTEMTNKGTAKLTIQLLEPDPLPASGAKEK